MLTRDRLRRYLDKHALLPPLIPQQTAADTGLIVVIPVCDEPDIGSVLESLLACDRPDCGVEVLLVINHAADAPQTVVEQNRQSFAAATRWAASRSTENFTVHASFTGALPQKKAGVGLARKLGMDEAIRRFVAADNPAGIIACLDADCTVSANYLSALNQHFAANTVDACCIAFEHDLDACDSAAQRLAIARYELHLRLYVNGLRAAGYPHAFHTIGSSMAVTAPAYAAHGGMNQRQAGEDFYFLGKFMLTGKMSTLNKATVYPSPRLSGRTPFGTGARTREWMLQPQRAASYPPQCYHALRQLMERMDTFHQATPAQLRSTLQRLHPAARDYLLSQNIIEAVAEIQRNSRSLPAFRKRWLRWLNPFRVMQMVRRTAAALPPVAVEAVAAAMAGKPDASADAEQWLAAYRRADRIIAADTKTVQY